ncbi:hypothetical protein ACHAWF_009841 [Thalassiosira exigua]
MAGGTAPFPNSGTSYTVQLVRVASNATCATNYGLEAQMGPDGRSVPVRDAGPEGPFWINVPPAEGGEGKTIKQPKYGTSFAANAPPPSASILTKTHCGGRCASCPPQRYLETPSSFLRACLSGARGVALGTPSSIGSEEGEDDYNYDYNDSDESDEDEEGRKPERVRKDGKWYEKRFVTYQPDLVSQAVHLVRDPFDNLVSRYRHEQKQMRKTSKGEEWVATFPNDAGGFRKWCAREDDAYSRHEKRAKWAKYGYPADVARYLEGVPCWGEFFKYAQWHVLALRAAEALDVPTLYLRYEDYAKDVEATTEYLLDFLGLERAKGSRLPPFDTGKDYAEYFTREERASASEFLKRATGEKGRWLLERYFVEYDFDAMRAQTGRIGR